MTRPVPKVWAGAIFAAALVTDVGGASAGSRAADGGGPRAPPDLVQMLQVNVELQPVAALDPVQDSASIGDHRKTILQLHAGISQLGGLLNELVTLEQPLTFCDTPPLGTEAELGRIGRDIEGMRARIQLLVESAAACDEVHDPSMVYSMSRTANASSRGGGWPRYRAPPGAVGHDELPGLRRGQGSGAWTPPTMIGSPWSPPLPRGGAAAVCENSVGRGVSLWAAPAIPGRGPMGNSTDASGAGAPHMTRRQKLLLVLNGVMIVLVFAIIFFLLVWCSPLSGATIKANDQTGSVTVDGYRSHFLRATMPYWVPVEQGRIFRASILFAALFALMLVSTMALAFLWIMVEMQMATHFEPSILHDFESAGFDAGFYLGPKMFIVSGCCSAALPLAWLCMRRTLAGRMGRWSMLAFCMVLTFREHWSAIPFSYVFRTQRNWIYDLNADNYWHWMRTYFIYSAAINMLTGVGATLARTYLFIKWRRWLTGHLMQRYLSHRIYYLLNTNSGVDNGADNPDARIQEDVELLINSWITIVFSVINLVLGTVMNWLIVYTLLPGWTLFALIYCSVGSVFSLWFMWQFVRLHYESEKKSADWRHSLVCIRNNAESIAFYGGEPAELERVTFRFELFQEFSIRIMWWEVLHGVYTTLFELGLNTTPSVALTRRYFQRKLDYGSLGQFEDGFGKLQSTANYIRNNNDSLTDLALAITRVGGLMEKIDGAQVQPQIRLVETEEAAIQVRNMTVVTPTLQRFELIAGLSFRLGGPGHPSRAIFVGASGIGKSSIMRALAGLWIDGAGEITRPSNKEVMFLPQAPYMPLGTLRDQFCYPEVTTYRASGEDKVRDGEDPEPDEPARSVQEIDDELQPMLERLRLDHLPARFEGGFDHVDDWSRLLSKGEQQRVAAVRGMRHSVKLAVLDEATSMLSVADEQKVYEYYYDLKIPVISVGHRMGILKYHDIVIELTGNASYKQYTVDEYQRKLDEEMSIMSDAMP